MNKRDGQRQVKTGLDEEEIRRRLKRLREETTREVEIRINGNKRKISSTHRSILVNYALPFIKTLIEEKAEEK